MGNYLDNVDTFISFLVNYVYGSAIAIAFLVLMIIIITIRQGQSMELIKQLLLENKKMKEIMKEVSENGRLNE